MNTKREGMRLSDYYNGKTILVTGASGFIGKVLIWKLLHSCSNINTIFILIRSKYGKDVQHRANELLQTPIFDSIRKENPQVLNKVKAIAADIAKDRLALSEEDEQKLISSVQIIFHAAAVIKFDWSLKDIVNMNIGGTQRLLELATKMPNLQAFVHTSTAYSLCDTTDFAEKLYRSRETPHEIMELVRWMKPEILRSIENELVKPHPNTYTYSKRLAENLVADHYPKLPVAIARPTIVTSSLYEPFCGWIDNLNGVIGIMVAVGKGVLRVIWNNEHCHADTVPVDIVCNGLILIAWKTGQDTQRQTEIPIYNLGLLETELPTFTEFVERGNMLVEECPFSLTLWYPSVILTPNYYSYLLLTIFLQWIPACIIDAILYVLGQKTFMIRVQRKLYEGHKILSYFMTHEWSFVKENILRVKDELTEEERRIFKVTCEDMDRVKYALCTAMWNRQYLMKEDPANLPTAKRTIKKLYFLHCMVKWCFWLFVGWMLLRYINLI